MITTLKKIILTVIACVFLGNGIAPVIYASDVSGNPNFYTALFDVVSTDWNITGPGGGVRGFLQDITSGQLGAEGFSDFIVNIFVKVLIPLLALAGIIIAIIGFFKLMGSTDEADLKTGRNYLIWGVVGTLIMVSAAWIVIQMVGADGNGNIIGRIIEEGESPSGAKIASDVYREIAYPFIRVILNIIIGIIFLMAVGSGFKYLFAGDDEAQKHALAILVYTVVGILIIILAKTLVETIYGQYDTVITSTDALAVKPGGRDVGKIGDGVFENPNLMRLYIVINWLLGLSTFIVTTIIIYIGYLLLVQPTNEETVGKLKKAITRVIAGVLLIGAAYLIANFVIIK